MSYIFIRKKIYKVLFVDKNYVFCKPLLIDSRYVTKDDNKLNVRVHYSPHIDKRAKVCKFKINEYEYFFDNLYLHYTINGKISQFDTSEIYDDKNDKYIEIDNFIWLSPTGIEYYNKNYFI